MMLTWRGRRPLQNSWKRAGNVFFSAKSPKGEVGGHHRVSRRTTQVSRRPFRKPIDSALEITNDLGWLMTRNHTNKTLRYLRPI